MFPGKDICCIAETRMDEYIFYAVGGIFIFIETMKQLQRIKILLSISKELLAIINCNIVRP